MAKSQCSHYRGYDLLAQRQWSSWCVGIYPTRADLPLLPRSTLDILASRKTGAMKEAKQTIDRVLSRTSGVAQSQNRISISVSGEASVCFP